MSGVGDRWYYVLVFRRNNVARLKYLKPSERAMTTYNYKEPDRDELKDFILKNKAGEGKFAQLLMKIKIALTRNEYFERLFPTIKEQKPGVDLYAPMVIFQVLVIVFMIFFFTRMNPDNMDISADEGLAPTTFSNLMVLAVFLQIIVIVLDRYLYLSRDYVVIDEVELEEYDEEESDGDLSRSESISQFGRTKSFDLRSSTANKLLVKGLEQRKENET